jgi:hypothetical protein
LPTTHTEAYELIRARISAEQNTKNTAFQTLALVLYAKISLKICRTSIFVVLAFSFIVGCGHPAMPTLHILLILLN